MGLVSTNCIAFPCQYESQAGWARKPTHDGMSLTPAAVASCDSVGYWRYHSKRSYGGIGTLRVPSFVNSIAAAYSTPKD